MAEIQCPYCGAEAREYTVIRPCYIHVWPETPKQMRAAKKQQENNKKKKRRFRLRIQITSSREAVISCKACKKRTAAESVNRNDPNRWKAYMKANPRYFKSLFNTSIQRAAEGTFGLLK